MTAPIRLHLAATWAATGPVGGLSDGSLMVKGGPAWLTIGSLCPGGCGNALTLLQI
ncbi:hypothetical protein DPPLL_29610 [Desulfofustis limnaeus]|uniref:Uncharacterized protein n=1 Tax=Desulfofustis limnaeus TaxID=2740163 RepID=A0ABM7WC64_9BACT|nr:hypothetical protein DPPLL_29610 [Desulfofustis limnaeus]